MSKPVKQATSATKAQAQGVAVLDRAFAVLGAFLPVDTGGLSLAELSARTGLYKSTILRLAQSLIEHQFLQRIDDGRYQIGPAPLLLAAHYQRNLRLSDILLPVMRQLAGVSGESVSFYIRKESVRVCLLRVDSKHAIRDHILEGDVLPLHRGSGGRVLMAFSGARGEPHETIRTNFCYVSLGERDPETAGISAPVFGSGERLLGALTLTGPRSRIDQEFMIKMRAPLLEAAARATSSLGGDASFLDAAAARRESKALPAKRS
jgi:DNA-binding IclR family transcriptional regulator